MAVLLYYIFTYIHVSMSKKNIKKTNFMIFKKDPGHFIWNGFLLLFMKWRVHPTCCRVVVVSYFFFPRAWKKFSRWHVRLQLRVTRNRTRHFPFFFLPVFSYLFFSLLHPYFSFILSFMIALGENKRESLVTPLPNKNRNEKSVTNREIPINKIKQNNFMSNLSAKKLSRAG